MFIFWFSFAIIRIAPCEVKPLLFKYIQMQEMLTLKINIESSSIYKTKMKFKYVQHRSIGSLEAWLILGQKKENSRGVSIIL